MTVILAWLVFPARLVRKASQVSTPKTDLPATMELLESTVNREHLELMVFAAIKVHKALLDPMDMLVSRESTVSMVLEVRLAVLAREELLETAERMVNLANPGLLVPPVLIISPARATVKVLSLVSKEFEVMLVQEANQVKKELKEKLEMIILTAENQANREKLARLEDEEEEAKVWIVDSF